MRELTPLPTLVEQVYEAILAEISAGKLPPGSRIIQEQIAHGLGVSRQPVQQALLLLRNQGMLRDAPGRGLIVAHIDPKYVQDMYDVRAAIEGLACRRAAEVNAEKARQLGPALIQAGREAVASGSVAAMIQADMKFHDFVYQLSENKLIAPAMENHWTYTRRVMGEVLMRDERPRDIWGQHEEILDAVMRGDGDTAEALVRRHITQAAKVMAARLQAQVPAAQAEDAPAAAPDKPKGRASAVAG